MTEKKKLIEVALPLEAINKEAAREKSIRHGHPSTLHLWWARRPLAACRAVLFAQLVDDPSARPEEFPTEEAQDAERQRLFGIIERLVKWENSNNEEVLAEAKAEIWKSCDGNPPPILDPFAGGGSIPLEAQRLGLEAHASDLNPVAVLINKALIEIPPKWAGMPPVHPDAKRLGTETWKGAQGLAEDVRLYGKWMRDEAERRIGHLYPKATLPDGTKATVIAWLWARTVTCPNPACGATMPLVRSFWLGKKKGKEAWVNPIVDPGAKEVRFEIGHGSSGPPIDGTMTRAGAVCVVCNEAASLKRIREEGQRVGLGSQLLAVVAEGRRARQYLSPDVAHTTSAQATAPDGVLTESIPHNPRYLTTPNYGLGRHRDLYTDRQLLAMTTLGDLIGAVTRRVDADAASDRDGEAYGRALATYLALAADRVAMTGSSLVRWNPVGEKAQHMFGRQAVAMLWDFGEPNPFGAATGSITAAVEYVANPLSLLPGGPPGSVQQADAAGRPYAGLVIATDPPYYDNVGYADLADVFYVWLRRSLREVEPELLSTMLTPKGEELVADPYRRDSAEAWFEAGFRSVFGRIAEEATLDFPLTVFYAFRQAEEGESGGQTSTGWDTMLEGLVSSGLSVVATWPMRTEMATRMRSQGSNALASSIVLVCRPRSDTAGITDRQGFLRALHDELPHALRDLQKGLIAPVDMAQAAIGPGMAVFSRFGKVVEPSGEAMRVRTALGLINQVLDEVLAEQEGEFDPDTRWAVKWFEQVGYDDGPFGTAEVLFKATATSLDGLLAAGIVASRGGKVRLLLPEEYPERWDPTQDGRVPAWEVAMQLIRRLDTGGVSSAADLFRRVGGLADVARDLAYRLYSICERKKWSQPAMAFNGLVTSWPDIVTAADSMAGETYRQPELGGEA